MNAMNKPRKLLIFATALTALSAPFSLSAVDALSTTELALHCNQFHDEDAAEDRAFCVRYIQGFIDGAVATDARVLINVTQEYENDETYSERATRTRIGTRLNRYGPTVYADYCLGDPVPLREVVEHVVAALGDGSVVKDYPLARDVVYLSLRTNYPCTIED